MSEIKLKPCPFCGGKDIEIKITTKSYDQNDWINYIFGECKCPHCGLTLPLNKNFAASISADEDYKQKKQEAFIKAAEAWNTRAYEEEKE